jgi:hypothetical protein
MIYVAAVLVLAALVAMASGRVDPLLAVLVVLVLAAILGIAPTDELAAGLSNAGVITVAAMLVIAKGIVQTGVVSQATWALLASTATARAVFRRLALPIGVASALINTTPLVALLIPAARQLQQSRRIPAREVLLPLAHVTTLAGSVTLIGTSSNLVIAGIAGQRGVDMRRDGRPPGLARRDPGDVAGTRRGPPRGGARDRQDPGVRARRHPALGRDGRSRRADRRRRPARVRGHRGGDRGALAHAGVRHGRAAALRGQRRSR